jgi:hypothetical protein
VYFACRQTLSFPFLYDDEPSNHAKAAAAHGHGKTFGVIVESTVIHAHEY